MFGLLGPKTILSLLGGAIFIGSFVWIYVLITNLRAENASLQAQIAQQNAAVAQQAAADNAKAVADQARMDKEKSDAVAAVKADLDAANNTIATIESEADNAKPEEIVCPASGGLPVALIRAVDELHEATGKNTGSGQGDSKGQGRSGAANLPGLAEGRRPIIDIGPPRPSQVSH